MRYQIRFEKEEIDTFIACIEFKDFTFEQHLHRHIEYHFVERGKQNFTLDGKPDVLHAGDFLLIFPYHHHSFEDSDCLAHYGIINIDILASYYKIFLQSYPACSVIRKKELSVHIKNLVRYISSINKINNTHIITKDAYTSENEIEKNTLHDAVRCLVGEALKALTLVASKNHEYSDSTVDTTSKIINYCISNYDKDISLSSVAKALFLNKDSVSRIFSKSIGVSFNDFINEHRIIKACSLLQNERKNVVDIAFECGFKNQGTFNLAFKKFTKMTPKEYRSISNLNIINYTNIF